MPNPIPNPLDTLSVEFKRDVMTHLFRDQKFAGVVLPQLPDDFFEADPEYHVLFVAVREVYGEYKVVPLPHEVKRLVSERVTAALDPKKDEDRLEVLLNVLDRLTDPKAPIDYTPAVIIHDLYTAFTVHNVLNTLRQVPDLIENRQWDSIIQQMYQAIVSTSEDDPMIDWADTMWECIKEERQQHVAIPTNIPDLDRLTAKGAQAGGLPKKNLAVVMAPTGAGKSAFLVYVAAQAALMGYRVGYMSLELSKAEISRMVTACMTAISRGELFEKKPEIKATLKKLIVGKFKPFLKIWDLGPQGTSVTGIGGLLERLRLTDGVDLDLLIVDHFDDLKFSYGGRASHEVLGSEMQALRAIAHRYNIAIWTGTQGNRDSLSQEAPGMENLSLAYSKAFPLDLLITMSGKEEHRRKKYSRLTVEKNRMGPSKKTIHLDVDFATVSFRPLTETQAHTRGITITSEPKKSVSCEFGAQIDDEG
jgi:replicative DNA helicase